MYHVFFRFAIVMAETTESIAPIGGWRTEDGFRPGWIKDLPLSMPLLFFSFVISRSSDSSLSLLPAAINSYRSSVNHSLYTLVKLIVRLIGLTMRLSIRVTPGFASVRSVPENAMLVRRRFMGGKVLWLSIIRRIPSWNCWRTKT